MSTTTTKFVRTLDRGFVDVPCGECPEKCQSHRKFLPAGSLVLVRGVEGEWGFVVNGIARPSMHGGGVHVTATDPDTGVQGKFIVGGCYTQH